MNVCRRCHSGLEDCLHILCRVFFACSTGSGPISAIRSPPDGRQPAFATVKSQIFPSDSTMVPLGPFAASAEARLGYASRCQKAWGAVNCPTGWCAIIQHPTSLVRWLIGLQICADASLPSENIAADKTVIANASRHHAASFIGPTLASVCKAPSQ